MQPIFILSLPRSGSTLLQRILASHDEIHSASEPWILLPMLSLLDKERSAYADFGYYSNIHAINDFISELKNGEDDYLEEISQFGKNLYKKATPGKTRFFLDKTPRYHLVAEDLIRAFPEAKFIFLWRNPISIVSSMMKVGKQKGFWGLIFFRIDLFAGIDKLTSAWERYGEKSNFYSLQFEELVSEPENHIKKLCKFLRIEYNEKLINLDRNQFDGEMGDKGGILDYDEISSSPMRKWEKVISSPLKVIWMQRYLSWLGEKKLSYMGYNKDELDRSIKKVPMRYFGIITDLFELLISGFYIIFDPILLLHKYRLWRKGSRIYPIV